MLPGATKKEPRARFPGRVVDPAGQLVANAQVRLINQANEEARSAATDSEGEFVFVSIQPGTFTVSVRAEGFKGFSKHDIVLNGSDRWSVGTEVT
jgi:protocatechuate 3,4-dioxygenase beta subunit